MDKKLIWRGSGADLDRLIEAVDHNCPCGCAEGSQAAIHCPTHNMLKDQLALSHLEYGWRQIGMRIHEEFDT